MRTSQAYVWLCLVLLTSLATCSMSQQVDTPVKPKRSISVLSLKEGLDFVSTGRHLIREVYDMWHAMLRDPDMSINDAFLRSKEHEIIGRMAEINRKVSDLQTKVDNTASTTITVILRSFPEMIRLELKMHDLANLIGRINTAGENLKRYLIRGYNNLSVVETGVAGLEQGVNELPTPTKYTSARSEVGSSGDDNGWLIERYTLQNFAEWAVGHGDDSIVSTLARIHELVVPHPSASWYRGVFRLVQDTTRNSKEATSNTCNLKQSPQQLIYNLYNTVAMTELKGYTMVQFSLMLLKLYNRGNFTVEKELHKTEYEERTLEKINVARQAMSTADRSIYNCDPKVYVEGENYVRVTKLLQGFIENEVNLNRYGTCRETCSYYYYTEVNDCFKNKFCAVQPKCNGKVVQCQYIDSDMDVCLADGSSDRRYNWVEYENGRVLGQKQYCRSGQQHKVDSWWRYLFWHCSYCMCYCDDKEDSDRYFNLREVTSDITNHRVVTGLRIVKVNRIIHLQIQQGKLMERGMIDRNTTSWVPVDEYTVNDHDKVNGLDYHTMSWNERSMDLDEVFGPVDTALTGVRFRKIGTHLNLEIRVTPVNFTTGQVYTEQRSYWMGNDNTDGSLYNPRTKLDIKDGDIPTRGSGNTVDSEHDQYVVFQASDLSSDAGQNTIPYLDSQSVHSDGLMCSGAGLLHRGREKSGGFVAPKLMSYDFTPHMSPQLPAEDETYL